MPDSVLAQNNTRRLRSLSKQLKLTKITTLSLLLDFYELECLDLLINKIKLKNREGFTAHQLSQMSVLLTQLSVILQDRV
jgi:hypothetical protein